eukprot:TRINITY_DN17538_c0_g1_i1.p1 TRINITY_DN17538_c0_g1~~TRINITY_DN17538_c0_g1_i1.p1  ORF type:complete len:699 (+),score=184.17 TRINITY_DN17538_c0_g1_i1:38-2134(+)
MSTNNTNTGKDFHVGGERVQPTSTFSVAQTISQGQVPHNEQILSSLKEIEDPLQRQAHEKGGVEGRIAQQTQQLVQHTRELLQEKNSDDTFSKIRTHTKEAGIALADVAKDQKAHSGDHTKWTDEKILEVRHLLQSFRSTATVLAKNNNFRGHIIEFVQILQTLFFDFTNSTLDKKLTDFKNKPIASATSESGDTTHTHQSGDIQPHVAPFTQTDENFAARSAVEQSTETSSATSGEDHVNRRTQELIQSQQSGIPAEQKKMSDEERQHLFEKLRNVMLELGHTSEYKQLIERLTTFMKNNGQHIASVAGQGKSKSKTAINALGDDIQELLEKCSGDQTLTPIRERIGKVILNIQNNADVRNFFSRVRELFRDTVTKPEEQNPEKIDKEIRELSQESRVLLKNPEYRDDINVIFNELKGFLGRVKEDPNLRNISTDVAGLRRELMLNEKGQIDFGTIRSSLPALKNVLVPAITSALKTVPIPPIHSDDERYTVDITNVSVSSDDILPENATIHFANDIFFDFSGHGNDHFDSTLSLALNEFTTNLKDLNFHYERKKMPRMSDAGVADVTIVGTNIKLRWKMEKVDEHICFQVDKVGCTMRQLNTNVKQAQHKILDKFALKMFNGTIKRSLEQSVEKALREKLEKFTINTTTHELSSSLKSSLPGFMKKSSSSDSSTLEKVQEKAQEVKNQVSSGSQHS